MSKHKHCECGCGTRVRHRFVRGHRRGNCELTEKQIKALAKGREIQRLLPRTEAQLEHTKEMGKKNWKKALDVAHSLPPTAKQLRARKRNMRIAQFIACARPRTKKQLLQYKKAHKKLNRVISSETNGSCEICGEPCWVYKDHDHTNGKRRGELCRCCNLGLGCFRDSTTRLKSAVEYIKTYRKKHKDKKHNDN